MFRRETLSLSLRPVLVLSKIFSSFLASFLPAKIPYLNIKKMTIKREMEIKEIARKGKREKKMFISWYGIFECLFSSSL